jgi:hypothetical protein
LIEDKQLDDNLSALGETDGQPPDMGDALRRVTDGMTAVKMRKPRRQLVILTAVSLAYAMALVVITSFRRDLPYLPLWWVVSYVGTWLVSFVGLAWLAMVPPTNRVIPNWRVAGILAVVSAFLFTTGGLLFAKHVPGHSTMYEPTLSSFWSYGKPCLRFGMINAIVPVALAALFLRRALPVGSRWWAAAIGAAGGSLGGFALHLHCPIAEKLHLGLIHGGVVVLAAITAALIVPRVVRP